MLLVIAPCCLSCLQPVAVAREMGDAGDADAGDARAPGDAGALPPRKRAAEEHAAPPHNCGIELDIRGSVRSPIPLFTRVQTTTPSTQPSSTNIKLTIHGDLDGSAPPPGTSNEPSGLIMDRCNASPSVTAGTGGGSQPQLPSMQRDAASAFMGAAAFGGADPATAPVTGSPVTGSPAVVGSFCDLPA